MRIWFGILLVAMSCAYGATELYAFKDAQQAQRFDQLTHELRCLVCQNQNIAESNAGLANDLRREIYNKITAGEDNTAIINYLVARYGNFILYKPPVDKATIFLWCGPLVFLLLSLAYLIYYLRAARRNTLC